MKNIMKSALVLVAAAVSFNAVANDRIALGKVAVEKQNCASCHGVDYNTSIDPSYPKLAGQYHDYLRQALVSYQRGNTAMNGRNNAIMTAEAKKLSREDIENISAYLASLPGTLVVRK